MQDSKISVELLNRIRNEKISVNNSKKIFMDNELNIIKNMYIDGSIMNKLDKESGDEVIVLTNRGKFIVFNEEHSKEILDFSAELESRGYNTCYIVDYIKICNLDDDINKILSVDGFDIYMHNISLLNNNSGIARRILIKNRNIG